MGPINNTSSLVHVVACCRICDKTLPEPALKQLTGAYMPMCYIIWIYISTRPIRNELYHWNKAQQKLKRGDEIRTLGY